MSFQYTCSNCQTTFALEKSSGEDVICPKCQSVSLGHPSANASEGFSPDPMTVNSGFDSRTLAKEPMGRADRPILPIEPGHQEHIAVKKLWVWLWKVGAIFVVISAGGLLLWMATPAEEEPHPAQFVTPKPPVQTDLFGDPLPKGAFIRLGWSSRAKTNGNSAAFSPDGKVLITEELGGPIRGWHAESRKPLWNIDRVGAPQEPSMAISSDGRSVASYLTCEAAVFPEKGTIAVWDTTTQAKTREIPITGPAESVTISADGTLAYLEVLDAEERALVVLKANGEELYRISGVQQFSFFLDKNLVATGRDNEAISVRDSKTGKELRKISADLGSLYWMQVSPNGKFLGTLSKVNTTELVFRDVTSGREFLRFQNASKPVYSPDSKLIAFTVEKRTLIWDIEADKAKCILKSDATHSVTTFSPDGKSLVTVEPIVGVCRWDIETGQEIAHPRHRSIPTMLDFSHDGKTLASAGTDKTIRVWDTVTGKQIHCLETSKKVYTLAYCKTSDKATVAAGMPGEICVWDLPAEKIRWSRAAHARAVVALEFSGDGKRLASGGVQDEAVWLWDASSGKSLWDNISRDAGGAGVNALRFSDDGTTLTGVRSGARQPPWVARWEITSGKLLFSVPIGSKFEGRPHVSVDGNVVATSNGEWGTVYEVATGNKIVSLQHPCAIVSTAFSPNGRILAAATHGADNSIRLWEIPSGRELLVIRDQDKQFGGLTFSPDGDRLASGCEDGTILIWDIKGLMEK